MSSKPSISIKKNKIFGYIIILVGLSLPLYVLASMTYREWVNVKSFERFSFLPTTEDVKEWNNFNQVYNASLETVGGSFQDPFVEGEELLDYPTGKSFKDKVIGYIRIPKLQLTKPIYLGASEEHLSQGIAHLDGTHLFSGEGNTRTVLAGHRGYYQDFFFLNLHKLEAGDLIYINLFTKEAFTYEVINQEIIQPEDWQSVLPAEEGNILTLLTCDPILPPSDSRLLVNARLLEEKVEQEKEIKEENPLVIDKQVPKMVMARTPLHIGVYIGLVINIAFILITIVQLLRYIVKMRKHKE